MSVETTIKGIFDKVAADRQAAQTALSAGTGYWTRVDAAGDETFENRVKGADMTAVDTTLRTAAFWGNTALKKVFTLISDYLRLDLGLAYPYITNYVASKGWRVPYEAAQALVEALGSGVRLPSERVFPKGTLVESGSSPLSAGLHQFGRITGTTGASTFAVIDGALPATVKGAAIMAVNEEPTPGLTNLVVTATNQAGAAKDLTVTVGDTQYTQEVLGQQLIGAAGAAAGQKVVPIPSTAAFAVGEWVLIVKSDFSVVETAKIASIQANTSITVETNLINSFDQNDLVWPLFTNCVFKSGTVGNGKHISLYARPDRTIAQ
jgi:hypothetical protein